MEMSQEEKDKAQKSQGGCGCQCHNKCGAGMNSCCGKCGTFFKGLIAGVLLCALFAFFCEHICDRHMEHCYFNSSSMTQNAEPDTHMMKNK